jgi:hypothetical protein
MAELAPRGVLRVGDRIRFEGRKQQVIGLEGTALRLLSDEGDTSVMAAGYVMAATDFEVLDRGPETVPERVLPPFALVDALPPSAVQQARFWEQHVVEVLTGLPPDAVEGTAPRPEYDPAWRTLMEREAAKVAELAAGGQQISKRTFLRMRQRYEAEGLWGLVDGRSRKPPAPAPGIRIAPITAVRNPLDSAHFPPCGPPTLRHPSRDPLITGESPRCVEPTPLGVERAGEPTRLATIAVDVASPLCACTGSRSRARPLAASNSGPMSLPTDVHSMLCVSLSTPTAVRRPWDGAPAPRCRWWVVRWLDAARFQDRTYGGAFRGRQSLPAQR